MLNSQRPRLALSRHSAHHSAAADLFAILSNSTQFTSTVSTRHFLSSLAISRTRSRASNASGRSTLALRRQTGAALAPESIRRGFASVKNGEEDARVEPVIGDRSSAAVGVDGTNAKSDVDLRTEEVELDDIDELAAAEELDEEFRDEEEEYEEGEGEGMGEEEIMELYGFFKNGTLDAEVMNPESRFYGLNVEDVKFELGLLDQALGAYESLETAEGEEGEMEEGSVEAESDAELERAEAEDSIDIDMLLSPEEKVRFARQVHGEILPEGLLSDEELQIYERLYGKAIEVDPERGGLGLGPSVDMSMSEEDIEAQEQATRLLENGDGHQLFREGKKGELEEVVYQQQTEEELEELEEDEEEQHLALESSTADEAEMRRIAEQLGGEVITFAEPVEHDEPNLRGHPLTRAGRFGTNPSTVFLPKEEFVKPVSEMLTLFSNKQMRDAAQKMFGGPGLPYSVATPSIEKTLEPKPIQLEAGQHNMNEVEGNTFMAAMMPGIYASVMGSLVEVRKRLGSDWLKKLMAQSGGPRVLDVGGGGAGVIAWREVLKAEFAALTEGTKRASHKVPLGKATVLTGSTQLRQRSSVLLENTTFLPRLPDYVHVRDAPTLHDSRAVPARKQYDVIIASHSLWPLEEEYQRKQHVQNLWSLLNPEGGVLILLEKGRPRGFEAIAGAREHILDRFISSPGSTQQEQFLDSPGDKRYINKGTGMLIAPCTNHSKCPLYLTPGTAKGRRDFCHFEQRFIRPPFLRNILGSTRDHNHDDVKFSYVAFQRGVDFRNTKGLVQGQIATEAAFAGHGNTHIIPTDAAELAAESPANVHMLSLPRIMMPPLKRQGHIILDLCTPEGKLERWTVPKSRGKLAYRDARKSAWGDLWALGAKTRIPKNVRIGDKFGEGRKEKMERRMAKKVKQQAEELGIVDEQKSAKQIREEEEEELREILGEDYEAYAEESVDTNIAVTKGPVEDGMTSSGKPKGRDRRKEGKKKPAWVKRMENRKDRNPDHITGRAEKSELRKKKYEDRKEEEDDD